MALLIAISAAGQTPVPPAAAPASGMTTYRNDALRLSYSYPSRFVDASALVGTAMQVGLPNTPEAKCFTVPFARMGIGKQQAGVMLLARAEAACMKKKFTAQSVIDFTKDEAKGLTAAGAKPSFSDPRQVQVAGRPASMMKGSFALPNGQLMQTMVVCVLDEPDVACWQFLSNSPAELATMANFPVTFDGSPATPLVSQ